MIEYKMPEEFTQALLVNIQKPFLPLVLSLQCGNPQQSERNKDLRQCKAGAPKNVRDETRRRRGLPDHDRNNRRDH